MFYENKGHVACLNALFRWRSILTIVVLLWPGIVMIVRLSLLPVDYLIYARWLSQLTVFVFIANLAQLERFGPASPLFTLFSHMRKVMWGDAHVQESELFDVSDLDVSQIRGIRAKAFVDKASLKIFQKTLTCPEIEGHVAARMVPSSLGGGADRISVLDIGGGEGTFTAELFKNIGLQPSCIHEIVLLDPIDWLSEYRASLSILGVEDRLITQQQIYLSQSETTVHYDVVLASHSLYQECDGDWKTTMLVEETIGRVLGRCKTGGVTIVVLASRNGRAYEFKRAALQQIFGGKLEDIAAEDFNFNLKGNTVKSKYVDNIFDLGPLLAQYARKERDPLRRWLSYFLRYPFSDNEKESDRIVELLREYVVPLKALSEEEIAKYSSLRLLPSRHTSVLTHKVNITIVQS